ncbi:hypothetical protein ALC62_03378 [Cyphomyrmex costatus]|uniref:Uncharacterized protein n=1 Tax=Cyphomyrmex costatus TaxID=456900 RepID=A0A195CYJ1_9HYME|nr:hypothetical protein ALC62_03378 [Cyphomyrmex costatus]
MTDTTISLVFTQQNTLYISCVIMLAAEIAYGGTVPESARAEASSRESMTYRVRDSKVRNGNSSTCLQHVWLSSKEVGKRTGNNRHGRKFVRALRIEALASRQTRYYAQKSTALNRSLLAPDGDSRALSLERNRIDPIRMAIAAAVADDPLRSVTRDAGDLAIDRVDLVTRTKPEIRPPAAVAGPEKKAPSLSRSSPSMWVRH